MLKGFITKILCKIFLLAGCSKTFETIELDPQFQNILIFHVVDGYRIGFWLLWLYYICLKNPKFVHLPYLLHTVERDPQDYGLIASPLFFYCEGLHHYGLPLHVRAFVTFSILCVWGPLFPIFTSARASVRALFTGELGLE